MQDIKRFQSYLGTLRGFVSTSFDAGVHFRLPPAADLAEARKRIAIDRSLSLRVCISECSNQ